MYIFMKRNRALWNLFGWAPWFFPYFCPTSVRPSVGENRPWSSKTWFPGLVGSSGNSVQYFHSATRLIWTPSVYLAFLIISCFYMGSISHLLFNETLTPESVLGHINWFCVFMPPRGFCFYTAQYNFSNFIVFS